VQKMTSLQAIADLTAHSKDSLSKLVGGGKDASELVQNLCGPAYEMYEEAGRNESTDRFDLDFPSAGLSGDNAKQLNEALKGVLELTDSTDDDMKLTCLMVLDGVIQLQSDKLFVRYKSASSAPEYTKSILSTMDHLLSLLQTASGEVAVQLMKTSLLLSGQTLDPLFFVKILKILIARSDEFDSIRDEARHIMSAASDMSYFSVPDEMDTFEQVMVAVISSVDNLITAAWMDRDSSEKTLSFSWMKRGLFPFVLDHVTFSEHNLALVDLIELALPKMSSCGIAKRAVQFALLNVAAQFVQFADPSIGQHQKIDPAVYPRLLALFKAPEFVALHAQDEEDKVILELNTLMNCSLAFICKSAAELQTLFDDESSLIGKLASRSLLQSPLFLNSFIDQIDVIDEKSVKRAQHQLLEMASGSSADSDFAWNWDEDETPNRVKLATVLFRRLARAHSNAAPAKSAQPQDDFTKVSSVYGQILVDSFPRLLNFVTEITEDNEQPDQLMRHALVQAFLFCIINQAPSLIPALLPYMLTGIQKLKSNSVKMSLWSLLPLSWCSAQAALFLLGSGGKNFQLSADRDWTQTAITSYAEFHNLSKSLNGSRFAESPLFSSGIPSEISPSLQQMIQQLSSSIDNSDLIKLFQPASVTSDRQFLDAIIAASQDDHKQLPSESPAALWFFLQSAVPDRRRLLPSVRLLALRAAACAFVSCLHHRGLVQLARSQIERYLGDESCRASFELPAEVVEAYQRSLSIKDTVSTHKAQGGDVAELMASIESRTALLLDATPSPSNVAQIDDDAAPGPMRPALVRSLSGGAIQAMQTAPRSYRRWAKVKGILRLMMPTFRRMAKLKRLLAGPQVQAVAAATDEPSTRVFKLVVEFLTLSTPHSGASTGILVRRFLSGCQQIVAQRIIALRVLSHLFTVLHDADSNCLKTVAGSFSHVEPSLSLYAPASDSACVPNRFIEALSSSLWSVFAYQTLAADSSLPGMLVIRTNLTALLPVLLGITPNSSNNNQAVNLISHWLRDSSLVSPMAQSVVAIASETNKKSSIALSRLRHVQWLALCSVLFQSNAIASSAVASEVLAYSSSQLSNLLQAEPSELLEEKEPAEDDKPKKKKSKKQRKSSISRSPSISPAISRSRSRSVSRSDSAGPTDEDLEEEPVNESGSASPSRSSRSSVSKSSVSSKASENESSDNEPLGNAEPADSAEDPDAELNALLAQLDMGNQSSSSSDSGSGSGSGSDTSASGRDNDGSDNERGPKQVSLPSSLSLGSAATFFFQYLARVSKKSHMIGNPLVATQEAIDAQVMLWLWLLSTVAAKQPELVAHSCHRAV